MAKSFSSFRQPDEKPQDPFRDTEGRNPFADEVPPASPGKDDPDHTNLYATPSVTEGEPAYEPKFEPTLRPRGAAVFCLAALGTAITAVGLIGIAASLWNGQEFIAALGMMGCAPLSFFALICSWPAWLMGRHDIRAIKTGAMDRRDHTLTAWGLYLGVASTLINLVICLLIVGSMLTSLLINEW